MQGFKIFTAAAVFLCAVNFSAPLLAEEETAPAEKSAGEIYDEHVKNLTAVQKAELAKLEEDFRPTMEPDVSILYTAAHLQYCSDTNPEFKARDPEYAAAFIKWRDKVNAWQHTLWQPHLERRNRIDYVPQDVLGNYYEYTGKIFLVLTAQLAQLAREMGGFKRIDCAALGAELLSGTKPTQWELQADKNPENAPNTAQ